MTSNATRLRAQFASGDMVIAPGAYDGITMSNTYQLFLRGWRGIFIEGMEDRFRELTKNKK